MSDERPIVIRLEGGLEYGIASIAEAKRVYPSAEIVRYQDGTAIDPDHLGKANAPVSETVNLHKQNRAVLGQIATGLGIEGADNKSAYGTRDDLIKAIEAKQAEPSREGDRSLVANPEFRDHSRAELDQFAIEWYKLDPANYEDDESLRLALVGAYDAETGTGEGESE